MDQIQLVLQQVLENVSQPLGSPSNSGSAPKPIPFNIAPLVKDISLGFPHFDGSTPVLEWIFKADKFFSFMRKLLQCISRRRWSLGSKCCTNSKLSPLETL